MPGCYDAIGLHALLHRPYKAQRPELGVFAASSMSQSALGVAPGPGTVSRSWANSTLCWQMAQAASYGKTTLAAVALYITLNEG